MSELSSKTANRYSLRPKAGRFDLKLNPYSLTRQTVKRCNVAKKFVPCPAKQQIKRQIKNEPFIDNAILQEIHPNSIKHERVVPAKKIAQNDLALQIIPTAENPQILPATAIFTTPVALFPVATAMPIASSESIPLAMDAPDHMFASTSSVTPIASAKQTVPIEPFGTPKYEWKQAEKTLRTLLHERQMKSGSYDESKPVYFSNLDDEILFEVFNHLSLNDLCATAEVSIHLKSAAQKYFEVMYTSMNLAWLIEKDAGKFTLRQAQRLLQCFGPLISTLIVDTTKMEQPERDIGALFELVGIHCHGLLFWNIK